MSTLAPKGRKKSAGAALIAATDDAPEVDAKKRKLIEADGPRTCECCGQSSKECQYIQQSETHLHRVSSPSSKPI